MLLYLNTFSAEFQEKKLNHNHSLHQDYEIYVRCKPIISQYYSQIIMLLQNACLSISKQKTNKQFGMTKNKNQNKTRLGCVV